jgi:RNA polymerase sigma-70 factor (ECF subfamily)
VVQETLIRAYRALSTFDGRASFSSWVSRIAANYSLDLLAARKRRNWQPLEGDDQQMGPLDTVADGDPTPERLALSGQIRSQIEDALETLSANERTAFVMRHFEGLSIEQIGSTLGVGEGAAKHSVFRAVQKLRFALRKTVE